jgi:formylglycine-generating enzyme required for sulfatase activity
MAQAGDTTSGGIRRRLHAALALLPVDPTQVEYLVDRLLQEGAPSRPDELIVIRKELFDNSHAEMLKPRLWVLLETNREELTESQFRAAGTLALFAPQDPRWPALGPSVAAKLVRENPLLIGAWREVFQPVCGVLVEPLRAISGDRSHLEQRALAFSLLFEFAIHPDNPHPTEDLVELIGEADPPLFRRILATIPERARAVALLAAKLDRPARFDDVLARRQGQMATALALLGESERIWPLFKHTDDPRARTELIHDLAWFRADSRLVIERLKTEPDISARRALVLALGEYPTDQVPADDRRALVSKLLAWYRDDPDPGVHGGVDWLLRQKWDQARALDRIDEELSGVGLPGARDWYVNGQGQTFAVVRGPVEFLMGSPEGEVDRDPDEILHRVRIGRSFAMATRPVTVVQYARFLDQNPSVPRPDKNVHVKPFIRFSDCPIVWVDWYDAAKYCNWLSGREGIPEAQWCYPKEIGPGMTLPQDYLSRTGYRLPTEAEWEYACRAGSAAARYYGGSEAMLPKFAWYMENAGRQTHPTGQLKPNDLGLFDMLGNVWEWTQDLYDPYNRYQTDQGDWPVSSNGTGSPVIDEEFNIVISNELARVSRGGSFFSPAPFLRPALRTFYLPSFRHPALGLRPARTYS